MRMRDPKRRPTAWAYLLLPLMVGLLSGMLLAGLLRPPVVVPSLCEPAARWQSSAPGG